MALSQKYLHTPSAIASYNYTDLAQNTGVTLFYALNDNSITFLSQNAMYSQAIEITSSTYNSDTYVKVLDADFDLTVFNAPAIVRGTARATLCFKNKAVVTTGANTLAYITLRIMKGATQVGTGDSSTLGTNALGIKTISIPLTQTSFKVGDALRLTVEGWGKRTAGADTGKIILGIDPMNRDGVEINPSTDDPETTTQLKVWVPFHLDL